MDQMANGVPNSFIQKLTLSASVYFIWQEWNFSLFRKRRRSLDEVVREIKEMVLLRIAWKKKRLRFWCLWPLLPTSVCLVGVLVLVSSLSFLRLVVFCLSALWFLEPLAFVFWLLCLYLCILSFVLILLPNFSLKKKKNLFNKVSKLRCQYAMWTKLSFGSNRNRSMM